MFAWVRCDFELNETFESYKKKLEQIKGYQREGDTYQVNFTMKKIDFCWQGNPLHFFFELKKYQPVRMASFIHIEKNLDICSCSPELFFYKKGESIVTKPMKGTAAKRKNVRGRREN